MEEFLPLLEHTALFEGLSGEEIAALCRTFHCRMAYYPKGSVILRRGEPVRRAGVVLCGSVRAERNDADGVMHVVARHGARSLFGDVLCASRVRKSPVDIVAAEDTRVLFVPCAELMYAHEDGGAELTRVRLNLLFELAEKYWTLNRQIDYLRAPTLRAKLARRLLMERNEQGSDAFTLSGTRETLAAELGVNRSALSRELGAMMRGGMLRARRGRFELLDVPALERSANE